MVPELPFDREFPPRLDPDDVRLLERLFDALAVEPDLLALAELEPVLRRAEALLVPADADFFMPEDALADLLAELLLAPAFAPVRFAADDFTPEDARDDEPLPADLERVLPVDARPDAVPERADDLDALVRLPADLEAAARLPVDLEADLLLLPAPLRAVVDLLLGALALLREDDAFFAAPALLEEALPVRLAEELPAVFAVLLLDDELRLFAAVPALALEDEEPDFAAEELRREPAPDDFDVPLDLLALLPEDLDAPERLPAAVVLRPEADLVELDADFPDFATAFFSLSSSEQSQSALLEERLFRVELPFFEA